ncbi:discoidin domain-containing protein [Eubacterium ventriosum]|nr:discoidin domain-containing protein [Eubacterium ventriosum]
MKLNKKMKRILAFVLSLAMVVSTFGLNVVSADDEWVSTNNGWINFTEDGYVTGDVNRYAVEGISAIYAGVWDDGKTANIDVLRNAETPNSLAIDVKDNTHDDQWLVQVACNVKGLDSTKVYKVELKLDGTTVLDTANVSSAEKYEKIVGIGNNEALTVGKHTLTLETEELVKGDTPVEVKNIEITPNEAQIAATRKIFANWTNPEGTAKAYAYLEEAKEENGVCTGGKGWVFNVSAAQPMTSVDNVSRTYSDTDTITVEPGKTYKFIVESFNSFGDKTGEGSVDITIPAKTQEEIDAENAIAEIKTKLSSDSNIAKNKEAFASSGVKTAKEAFDGNLGSRWIAETKNADEYVGVNLGKLYSLTSVAISWEGAYASEYEIQVSTDGEEYNTVKAVTATKADTAEFVFDEAVDAQFVKILCKKDGFGYPYSIWEVGAFGTEKGEGVTTVAPTTVAPAQDETTTPAKQDETTTPAPVVPTVPVAAEKDWSAEDFISSSDATYNDTYKAIKDGAINEIVNIQPADDTLGLYVSFADADFGTITVNGKAADIKVDGAGIWFKLSNFTDMYSDVVITNGAGTVKATLYVYNKNGVDNSKKDDETTTPAKQDETTTPAKQDETTTPAKQDETTTPAKQDETTTPAKQDETTTPAKQDETTTAKQDETTTAKQDVTTTTAKQNETTTVAPTTKAISTTAAPTTVKKTTVKKTTVKATAKKLSSNKVKLSVKKVAGASKYAVQISTTKNFKKVVAKKTSKKAVFTVKSKKLKGKKKLYVRVKVYKKVNGKTVASQWSKATKIRLKK